MSHATWRPMEIGVTDKREAGEGWRGLERARCGD